jgi:predicted metal-dependent hydrolase
MTISTNHLLKEASAITVREKLDFKLDSSLPKYWYEHNPIKTRLMDAVCATFPEGEKYFIVSVRYFRPQICNRKLRDDVTHFIQQEAQHGIVHTRYNDFLRQQGLPIDKLEATLKAKLQRSRNTLSPEMNLAITAACEHVTAMFARCFFEQQATMQGVQDPRILAMLAWHSIEEFEHKAVAFDVMQSVARVPYTTRASAMLFLTVDMLSEIFINANKFLKADGFSRWQRARLIGEGLRWGLSKNGVLAPMAKPWLNYFKPSFHPNQEEAVDQYPVWLEVFARTGDPILAGQAFHRAGKDDALPRLH